MFATHLESKLTVHRITTLQRVITVKTSCFDTAFASPGKMTKLPLIHCFGSKITTKGILCNLSDIRNYGSSDICLAPHLHRCSAFGSFFVLSSILTLFQVSLICLSSQETSGIPLQKDLSSTQQSTVFKRMYGTCLKHGLYHTLRLQFLGLINVKTF